MSSIKKIQIIYLNNQLFYKKNNKTILNNQKLCYYVFSTFVKNKNIHTLTLLKNIILFI